MSDATAGFPELAANGPAPSGGSVIADPKRISRRRLIWRRFRRNKGAVFGLCLLLALVLVAIVAPSFHPWSYTELDLARDPDTGANYFLKPPSSRHWFGTTQDGRDVLALVFEGLRKSLMIGFISGTLVTVIAAVVGSFAAYFGGWVERVLMWFTDLFLVLPTLLVLAIVTRSLSPGSSGAVVWLIILLAATGWMLSARVVRSLTLSIKERDYVRAARYMGVSGPRIIGRHILPNMATLLIVDATLAIAGTILLETALSFLGVGIRPPDISLGSLIGLGQGMATTFPWVFLFSAGTLVLVTLALFLMGDGLRDAFDPNSKAAG